MKTVSDFYEMISHADVVDTLAKATEANRFLSLSKEHQEYGDELQHATVTVYKAMAKQGYKYAGIEVQDIRIHGRQPKVKLFLVNEDAAGNIDSINLTVEL